VVSATDPYGRILFSRQDKNNLQNKKYYSSFKYLKSGTMLQSGRSQIPDEDLSIDVKPSSHNMVLVFTQLLIEMSTKNLPAGKGRPARKADNAPSCVS
jgi:hypothetical protein